MFFESDLELFEALLLLLQVAFQALDADAERVGRQLSVGGGRRIGRRRRRSGARLVQLVLQFQHALVRFPAREMTPPTPKTKQNKTKHRVTTSRITAAVHSYLFASGTTEAGGQ